VSQEEAVVGQAILPAAAFQAALSSAGPLGNTLDSESKKSAFIGVDRRPISYAALDQYLSEPFLLAADERGFCAVNAHE
jgi:hypothetical protein